MFLSIKFNSICFVFQNSFSTCFVRSQLRRASGLWEIFLPFPYINYKFSKQYLRT